MDGISSTVVGILENSIVGSCGDDLDTPDENAMSICWSDAAKAAAVKVVLHQIGMMIASHLQGYADG